MKCYPMRSKRLLCSISLPLTSMQIVGSTNNNMGRLKIDAQKSKVPSINESEKGAITEASAHLACE